ncbi:hypothetical protein J3R30DRAFT_3401316 [Lentinula aciculospora]|uniref:Uncharacterized protein n=1 Tax=Lentinula aciculospora TaxID=153920 RepID=A0A9W9APW3_9AGAR|nr:hypothetical protein J3R30DRAFT_3401316 [Lentinula aciculospora]
MAAYRMSPISTVSLLENNTLSTSAVVVALFAANCRVHSDDHLRPRSNSDIQPRWIHTARAFKSTGQTALTAIFTRVHKFLLEFMHSAILRVGCHLSVYTPLIAIRNHVKTLSLYFYRSWHLWIPWQRRTLSYSTYPTLQAEQCYWDSSRLFKRRLQSLDARFCDSQFSSKDDYEEHVPVISSYQPALPPLRTSSSRNERFNTGTDSNFYHRLNGKEGTDKTTKEYYLPTKAFRKWYRMTYPDQPPLDPLEASRLKNTYTTAERREIYRLSRLICNKKAYQVDNNLLDGRRYRYRDMWDTWQEENSSSEVEVVFEEMQ